MRAYVLGLIFDGLGARQVNFVSVEDFPPNAA